HGREHVLDAVLEAPRAGLAAGRVGLVVSAIGALGRIFGFRLRLLARCPGWNLRLPASLRLRLGLADYNIKDRGFLCRHLGLELGQGKLGLALRRKDGLWSLRHRPGHRFRRRRRFGWRREGWWLVGEYRRRGKLPCPQGCDCSLQRRRCLLARRQWLRSLRWPRLRFGSRGLWPCGFLLDRLGRTLKLLRLRQTFPLRPLGFPDQLSGLS